MWIIVVILFNEKKLKYTKNEISIQIIIIKDSNPNNDTD